MLHFAFDGGGIGQPQVMRGVCVLSVEERCRVQVHERSELATAIRQASRSGGTIEVDRHLGLCRDDVSWYAMRAGLYSPKTGYRGPPVDVETRGGVVRSITYHG